MWRETGERGEGREERGERRDSVCISQLFLLLPSNHFLSLPSLYFPGDTKGSRRVEETKISASTKLSLPFLFHFSTSFFALCDLRISSVQGTSSLCFCFWFLGIFFFFLIVWYGVRALGFVLGFFWVERECFWWNWGLGVVGRYGVGDFDFSCSNFFDFIFSYFGNWIQWMLSDSVSCLMFF